MSYARQAEAMDAVIGAGLGADPVRLHHPDGAACPGGRSAVPVDPRYATLLSRILASSSTAGAQCVQFVACGARAQATGVALAAARTAASLIGRSLVINARLAWDADSFGDGKAGAPIPDAFVPRLYHQWLAQSPADLALLFGSARRAAFNAVISPFRFVAIDCPSPSLAPAASALAPFCLGSVLVVRAGASTREAVREAVRHMTAAGGTIIGTVLDDVSAELPRWLAS